MWRDASHYDRRGERPCVLCGHPTPLRSHRREPAHKTCAEQWLTDHPGDDRFLSDPPARRSADDHA
ncbi:hypothetical protein [Streptomyces litchfieldiae]|uniref:Uncharacterized protein n=1 Tax=Streptomyces litchfieldiae TaxID=3075543 RepID=A0ABU2N181_9ACTN|nr:hypothetical protein [Streptomyces sp. DSM 44938]MDT0347530.1 hypothetical protein [Streptomyces sp. DSM 44938]